MREWEHEAIGHFIAFLKVSRGVEYRVVAEAVVVDPVTGTNFDFQLAPITGTSAGIAVEIFRLTEDGAEMAARSHLSALWKAIRREFERAGITGFVIRTPHHSPVLPRDAPALAASLARAVRARLEANPTVRVIKLDKGFEAHRRDGASAIGCSAHMSGRWLDTLGMITPQLEQNLAKKNGQLPASSGLERIVLCVNWTFVADAEDVADAIALMDCAGLQNTDRAYFGSGDTHTTHTLVYDRRVRDSLTGRSPPPDAGEARNLFEKALELRVRNGVAGAFELARSLWEPVGATAWGRTIRETLVDAARARVRDGDAAAGLWAVQRFARDEEPRIDNAPDDPEGRFNYHEQVLRGKDPNTCVGVRAAVCWLIQTMVCHAPKDAWGLMGRVEELASDPNLYVRINACVPLVEFARRRYWQVDGSFAMPEETRARTKALALRMLRENREHSIVLNHVAHVLAHLGDLDPAEAQECMGVLLPSTSDEGLTSAACLLVSFAVFREGHPNLPAPFDATFARTRLSEELAHGTKELRRKLAFVMFKTVEEDAKDAIKLKPYILMLAQGDDREGVALFFFEMVAALLGVSDADDEVERAVAAMVADEARRGAARGWGILCVKEIVQVLQLLADAGRWGCVAEGTRAVTAATPPSMLGRTGVSDLIARLPAEHRITVGCRRAT